MKKIFPIWAFTVFALFAVTAQPSPAKKSTIVIIPGSWSSAADWGFVVPQLKAAGNEVIVVNLAGHGTDKTPIASITMQVYVDAVKKQSAIGRTSRWWATVLVELF